MILIAVLIISADTDQPGVLAELIPLFSDLRIAASPPSSSHPISLVAPSPPQPASPSPSPSESQLPFEVTLAPNEPYDYNIHSYQASHNYTLQQQQMQRQTLAPLNPAVTDSVDGSPLSTSGSSITSENGYVLTPVSSLRSSAEPSPIQQRQSTDSTPKSPAAPIDISYNSMVSNHPLAYTMYYATNPAPVSGNENDANSGDSAILNRAQLSFAPASTANFFSNLATHSQDTPALPIYDLKWDDNINSTPNTTTTTTTSTPFSDFLSAE